MVALVVGLVLAGCGGAADEASTVAETQPTVTEEATVDAGGGTGSTSTATTPPATTPTTPTTPGSTGAGTAADNGGTDDEQTTASVYWMTRDGDLATATRTVALPAVGAGAVEALLAGPTADERAEGLGSEIPDGTRLHGLDIDGGVATVDLSSAFASGGGSASMRGRVAQVVYTLTQFPTVDAVQFRLDGEPIDVLGGEGLLLEEPVDRDRFADLAGPDLDT